MNLHRFFPPVQLSACSVCAKELRERKRKPCPRCGGMSRTIQATANDSVTAIDKAN